MTTIITCRGISEPVAPQRNMLWYLVDALPDDWTRIDIPYSASYGPVNPNHDPFGESFDHTLAGAYELLDRAITNADGPVVVAGYSAGAAAVGNLLARKKYSNVVAVILVADPFAPGGRIHGIAGSRIIKGYNVRWISNPNDVICSCPDSSPLRAMADVSAAMSLGDPNGWGMDILDRLATNRWQAVRAQWWNPLGIIGAYAEAADDAAGYLGLGRYGEHTVYSWQRAPGSAGNWLQEAAAWAARQ